jgi:M6 family metalloprotease-like protein
MKTAFMAATAVVVTLISGVTPPCPASSKSVPVPSSGHVHAVVVFVRFADDTVEAAGSSSRARAWRSPDRLPDFAHRLLSSTPVPPFREETLTDYFYRQSRGRLVLYGDAYPMVVTVRSQSEYVPDVPGCLDLHRLTGDVLHAVNGDPGFDLAKYDADEDGFLDYVYLVVRGMEAANFLNGAAGYSQLRYTSPRAEFGRSEENLKRVRTNSGSYVRYDAPGHMLPELDLIRTMAHELGHNLWPELSTEHHRPLINPNGVPEGESHKIGYALMVGALSGQAEQASDVRGDYTIAAFERELVDDGWIECHRLEETRSDILITDLYTGRADNCYKLVVPEGTRANRTVYLSNRQRVGFFDRLRSDNGIPPHTGGLHTTGLLVMAVQKEPMFPGSRFAVVAADNTLAINDSSYTYQGDLFGPSTRVQLSPWTRPNSAAFTFFPENLRITDAHFQAIDRIRETGGPGGEMAFDYIRDFRTRPVIRENSWMGRETDGYTFTADVVVTNGATLTVETDVQIASSLTIEEGSTVFVGGTLVLTESSLLRMMAGSSLRGRGHLVVDGSMQIDPLAELRFPVAVEIGPSSAGAPRWELDHPYPNPFSSTTTIRYSLARPSTVQLSVTDLLGRTVRVLVSGHQPAGAFTEVLDGSRMPCGLYLLRLSADDVQEARSLTIAR